MDLSIFRQMLDELGIPKKNYYGQGILEPMEAGEKIDSFFSAFSSRLIHDGSYRKTGLADEFVEYEIVDASYIIRFGYGIDGVRYVCVYPHCDVNKLRDALVPLVAEWKQELVIADEFNASQQSKG